MEVYARSAVVDDGSQDEAHVVDGIGYLPLRNRDAAVVGWALADADAFDSVALHKWSISGAGYVGRKVSTKGRQRMIYLQRAVLDLDGVGEPQVRFRNGDRLDCRRSNLRLPTAWAARIMSNPDTSWAFALLVRSIYRTVAA